MANVRIRYAGLLLYPLLTAYQCGETTTAPCDDSTEQTVEFQVRGNCGPAGFVSAYSAAGTCSGELKNGRVVGLPTILDRSMAEGQSFENRSWSARGRRADEGPSSNCRAFGSSQGDLELRCSEANGHDKCTAILDIVH